MKFKLSIIFLLIAISIKAQFSYTTEIEHTHNLILDLKLSEANDKIKRASASKNQMWHWLKAQHTFITVISELNFNTNEDAILSIDESLKKVKKARSNSELYHYCLADIYFFKSYLHYMQDNYFATLTNYQKAKKHYRLLAQSSVDQIILLKHELIIDFVNATLANNVGLSYNFQNKLAKYIGKVENSSNNLIVRELKILIPLLSNALNNNEVHRINWVNSNFATNGPLETYTYYQQKLKLNEHAKAYDALLKAQNKNYLQRFNYLNLLLGNQLLNRLDSSAHIYFQEYIENNKYRAGNNYASLKLSWFKIIYPETQLQIKPEPNTSSDFYLDQQARYEFKNKSNWLPELLKARLLFDAGMYNNSLKILLKNSNKVNTYSNNQKLTYAYRIARNYDKLGDNNKAKKFYNMVIHSGLDNEYYYPAYAAYYCGEICKTEKEKAIAYYKLCMKLNSPIYKNSIHNRASIALKRLAN